ncbi:MAG: hypothetical protein Q8O67_00935 [Deltaproteobacteria bacterium]|nr:hypothetical protein [Deltaproteobacteria bacterium]
MKLVQTAVVVVVVAVAAGCARKLEELAPFPCGVDGTCPARFACTALGCLELDACDVVDDVDCGPGRKCTGIVDLSVAARRSFCVALADGADQDGEACSFTAGVSGDDTCDEELACDFFDPLDFTNADGACRAFCGRDVDCSSGLCVGLGFADERGGRCLDGAGCAVLEPGCPLEQSCKLNATTIDGEAVGACISDGERGVGAVCASSAECGANLACRTLAGGDVVDKVCLPSCNFDHACPDGSTCESDAQALAFCTCDPFVGDAVCGAGRACLPLGESTACTESGARLPGASCDATNLCVADAICDGVGVCRALCDAAHPCASGDCQLLNATLGSCQ